MKLETRQRDLPGKQLAKNTQWKEVRTRYGSWVYRGGGGTCVHFFYIYIYLKFKISSLFQRQERHCDLPTIFCPDSASHCLPRVPGTAVVGDCFLLTHG